MAIETFEGLPIVDTGGRSLITQLRDDMVEQDAKKISFPNDGADFGNSGDQLRSLGDGGVEWAAPGMPTYADTERAISNWLDEHPEATTTIIDGSITEEKLNSSLESSLVFNDELDTAINNAKEYGRSTNGAVFVTPEELVSKTEGVYTLGDVTIDSPMIFNRQSLRDLIIVDSVIRINTPVLIPAYRDDSYFIMPYFINCIFINAFNDNRCAVTNGSIDTVGTDFIGCKFYNVDCCYDSSYIQEFNFIGCFIQSHTCFLECVNSTVQAKFTDCSVEAESNQLVKAKRFVGNLKGVFEGNISKQQYLIECTSAAAQFDSCWFEAELLIKLAGSTARAEKSVISFINDTIQAPQIGSYANNELMHVTNPSLIVVNIINTAFAPNNTTARFTNVEMSDFLNVFGELDLLSSDTYVAPFGGKYNFENQIVNERYLAKRHIDLQTYTINSDGITFDNIPYGSYLLFITRDSHFAEYIVELPLYSGQSGLVTKINGSNDDTAYVDATTVTLEWVSSTNYFDTLCRIKVANATAYGGRIYMTPLTIRRTLPA